MQEISINKNDVGGYEYNGAVTLIKQINRVLEQQLFEESADGMVRHGSATPNTLTSYKSNVAITKSDVKRQSITEAEAASSTINIVAPDITTNADAKDEGDRQNMAYAQSEQFSADLSPTTPEHKTSTTINTNDRNNHQSKFRLKAERGRQTKFTKYVHKMKDEGIIDLYITKAEDKRTAIAKQDRKDARRITIDT